MSPVGRRPSGYTLVAVMLSVAAAFGFLTATFGDLAGDRPWGVQAAALLTAALAAVAAEALWNRRSWCVRATATYGCANLVSYLIQGAAMHDQVPGALFFGLVIRAIVVWLVVEYVNRRAAQLFGPPRSTIPIAVPRPRP